MLVGRSNIEEVLAQLSPYEKLGLDTETTGLRPYHGDRIFAVIITAGQGDQTESFYFNFQAYEGLDADKVLAPSHMATLQGLFGDGTKTWYIHNAKFDLAFLWAHGLDLAGQVHCTKTGALIEYNEHISYDLESCGERIGFPKDDAVAKYIKEHKLTESRQGATQKYTHEFFDRVPPSIIIPYGERDGEIHYRLGRHQEKEIERLSDDTRAHLPRLRAVLENEKRLTKTLHRMQRVGVRIDRDYCVRAARYEDDRLTKASEGFKSEAGRDLSNSWQCFAQVFKSEETLWDWGKPTKTGQINPSFNAASLGRFKNPAARHVLDFRDAKSKRDFYRSFLYHADGNGDVHPDISQDGAAHGRTSSSNPNFQNLTAEEGDDLDQEFVVRRAIIPRPGFVFFMPDWDQMEYRMMFDVACDIAGYESQIVKEIKAGKDPHQATADTVCAMGTQLSRQRAKNGNFAILYGSGYQTLADTIGGTLEDARALKTLMRKAAPEVQQYIDLLTATAKARGYITNWFGRRCYLPNKSFAYAMPNYHIAGGSADCMKVVMNRVDERCLTTRSRIILSVHDELPMEISEEDLSWLPRFVTNEMQTVYPYVYLPLTASAEWSATSLADKKKGYPV